MSAWDVEVFGHPRCGRQDFVERFEREGLVGIAGVGGAWSMRAVQGDRVLVASDAFGGEPLFIDASGRRVDPDIHRGPLEPAMVRQHLDAELDPPWLTWWKGVFRVPAGWGGPPGALEPIWQPIPRQVDRPARALRACLLEVIGDFPPGGSVALSGGLDSSVLAVVAPVNAAVRNSFPGWPCDEAVFAEAAASRAGLPLSTVDSRGLGPRDVLELFAPPAFPPVFVNHYLNLALARRAGDALWTGFGGDEVIGHGLGALGAFGRAGQRGRLIREAVALAVHERVRPMGRVERWRRWGRAAAAGVLGRGGGRERHLADLRHPFLQRSREEQLRLARTVGVELRLPFLDAELAALSLDISDVHRVHRGRTRWVLREAFWDELPDIVRWRADKADLRRSFDQAFAEWWPDAWPLISSGVLDPWWDARRLERLRAEFEAGEHLSGAALFRAHGAARWLSWHASGEGNRPVGSATAEKG